MHKDKFKVFISDWDIPKNSILALVHKKSLFVIDEFSVELSSSANCFKFGRSTDRYISFDRKLEYSRYSMNGFELVVDGKIRDDVLWFSIRKKNGDYFIDSPYPFVSSIGFSTCLLLFFINVITVGFASPLLISLYRDSLIRSSRILRMMQGRVFEMATGGSAYKKLESAPSVVTAKEFDMEMNFQDYLAKKEQEQDVKSSFSESISSQPQESDDKESTSSKLEPITLTQNAFSEPASTSFSTDLASNSSTSADSISSSLESSTPASASSMDANYSVSESSLPVSSSSLDASSGQEASEVKSTVKKRVTRRKKSSV